VEEKELDTDRTAEAADWGDGDTIGEEMAGEWLLLFLFFP